MVEALLHGIDAKQPVEALVVDSARLIRVLQLALDELNNRRLNTPNFTGDPDIVGLIRYWDAVLGWVQGRHTADVVVTARRT